MLQQLEEEKTHHITSIHVEELKWKIDISFVIFHT